MDKRHEDSIMELDIGDEVTVYGTVYLVGEVLGYGINVDYIE